VAMRLPPVSQPPPLSTALALIDDVDLIILPTSQAIDDNRAPAVERDTLWREDNFEIGPNKQPLPNTMEHLSNNCPIKGERWRPALWKGDDLELDFPLLVGMFDKEMAGED